GDVMLLEKAEDSDRVGAFEELAIFLVATGDVVSGAPGKGRPAVENATPGHEDLVIDEAVAQENIVRLGVFLEPFHQRIADILDLDPDRIVNGNQVNGAAQDNCTESSQGRGAGNDRKPARPYSPEPPDAIGNEEVAKDQPNVEILVIGECFEAHLEAE